MLRRSRAWAAAGGAAHARGHRTRYDAAWKNPGQVVLNPNTAASTFSVWYPPWLVLLHWYLIVGSRKPWPPVLEVLSKAALSLAGSSPPAFTTAQTMP